MDATHTECEGHAALTHGLYGILFSLAMFCVTDSHYAYIVTGLGFAIFAYGMGHLKRMEKFEAPEVRKNSTCKICREAFDKEQKIKASAREAKEDQDRQTILKAPMNTAEMLAQRNEIFADLQKDGALGSER